MLIEIIFLSFMFAVAGLLSGFTGSGADKSFRRLAIPALTSFVGLVCLWNANAIGLMLRWVAKSAGYGMPDGRDSGSFLGKFWTKKFPSFPRKAEAFTRGSIGVLDSAACATIPMVVGTAGTWALWAWASVALVAINVVPVVCFPSAGQFELKGLRFNWHEVVIDGASMVVIVKLLLLVR